jgi:hypothetical protein
MVKLEYSRPALNYTHLAMKELNEVVTEKKQELV